MDREQEVIHWLRLRGEFPEEHVARQICKLFEMPELTLISDEEIESAYKGACSTNELTKATYWEQVEELQNKRRRAIAQAQLDHTRKELGR